MTQEENEFGDRVRTARKSNGVGLRELARIVDIDYSNLSRIERGQRPPPDLEKVIEIAEELHIDKRELLVLAGVPKEIISNEIDTEDRNWISGRVVGREGKLTKIEAGDWTLHIVGNHPKGELLIGLRPEDITLYLNEKGFSDSSARNRIKGTIIGIKDLVNYNLVEIECGSFSLDVAITDTSLRNMNLSGGKEVFATFKATAPVVKPPTPQK